MRKLSLKSVAILGLGLIALSAVVVATATASTKTHKASVQVCVLLPDTKSSVRWVQFDAPAMKAAFAKAGVKASINNALNDPLKQKAQAQACIAAGATVVIETALDNGSAAAIEKLFTSKGGKAIDYDRQVTGGSASVYVTFDGKAVGEAQAKGVIAGMQAKGTYAKHGVVAELWGGQTDQNAFWFKSGNDAVFNPLFKSKALTKGPQKFVPDWDANNAATIFNQMLVQTNNKIDGVLAANDNIAGAVVADLKAKHLPPIPLSGQDATAQGIQYIISGWQTGTVYKYVPDEANAAAAAAVALIKGQTPKSNGFRLNGTKKEPTLALPVIWITKKNYTRLFTDHFLKKSDVCVGAYAKYCK
ncbi:MAG TPA: substrate-binding domain-containing protein [Gaiellaceae bacterium]|nr:substrate-binding domain-containing protein [Gaiellaceae bacterium]